MPIDANQPKPKIPLGGGPGGRDRVAVACIATVATYAITAYIVASQQQDLVVVVASMVATYGTVLTIRPLLLSGVGPWRRRYAADELSAMANREDQTARSSVGWVVFCVIGAIALAAVLLGLAIIDGSWGFHSHRYGAPLAFLTLGLCAIPIATMSRAKAVAARLCARTSRGTEGKPD